ncbi:MAG TPA: chromate transporter [Tissierellaceae bacterium]|nr:chromate transporter [Tissierellaceae bacterium]
MLWEMFLTFFKIGAFTFGGGFAMIPIIQQEVVEKRHWVEEENFLDTISIAQSSPGPIAVNSSIFVGYQIKGVTGAIIATLGAVLPSFIIILLIAKFFYQFIELEIVEKVFLGIRPAVVALIFSTVFNLVYKSRFSYLGLGVALIVALIIVFLNINPVFIIILAALISVIANKLKGDNEEWDEE